ncbi:MAG: hypothetical protein AAF730_12770 [Bacteroidota bacterium]
MNPRLFFALLLCAVLIQACDQAQDDPVVEVVAYDGDPINPNHMFWTWEATFDGNEITIQGHDGRKLAALEAVGDEGPVGTVIVTFRYVPGDLPVLLDAWIGPCGGGLGSTEESGQIAIETWEPERLLSGRLSIGAEGKPVRPVPGIEDVFWIDVQAPA